MSFWIVPPMASAGCRARRARRRSEQDDRRPVDGHRRRDLVERDAVEQHLHVAQRVDRDAAHPDLAERRGESES
jgi:hypothetical protein